MIRTTDTGRPVVLTNLSLYEPDHEDEMRSILKSHFELVELNLSESDDLSWAYINMLQTRDVIIVAGIENPISDKEALEQIRSLYPEYKDKIYQVQMREFIAKGGSALNCCTWTISNEMSHIPHNPENDLRYKELVTNAVNNESAISEEEMLFLGDYYPLKLENVSYLLDKLYWRF